MSGIIIRNYKISDFLRNSQVMERWAMGTLYRSTAGGQILCENHKIYEISPKSQDNIMNSLEFRNF